MRGGPGPAASGTAAAPSGTSPAFDSLRPPRRADIDDCVHCGFCLPVCPTYQLWGEEADSPRGRILLMDAALSGTTPLTPELVQHWDACLGCMACVPACPSGVRYDRLIEATRQQVERRASRSLIDRLYRSGLFAVLPHRRRMRVIGLALAVWRASGGQRSARRLGLTTRLPERVRALDGVAPVLGLGALLTGSRRTAARVPAHLERRAGGAPLSVMVLRGCVQDGLFPDVTAATARVLRAHGALVMVPANQGCCGALELHSGREEAARRRARALVAAVERAGPDRLAINAAGCGSAIAGYAELLADDPEWHGRAARLVERTRDISQVLGELSPLPAGTLHPLPLRVAYHDACHLAHAQGIRAAPRAILGAIPGLILLELDDGALCCGSAGVYNLLEPGPAAELGRRKARAIRRSGAEVVAAGNPGCLVQIEAWLASDGQPIPAFHPVQLLDASLRGLDGSALVAERRRLLVSAGLRRPG